MSNQTAGYCFNNQNQFEPKMKKIYLDWNVINHLEESPELYEFILNNQSHFVFVYSPAHFSDLMRSLKKGEKNEYFAKDLERFEAICETHLMRYEENKMRLYCCSPSEFYKKEGESIRLIESAFKPSFYRESLCTIDPRIYDVISDNLRSIDFGEEKEIPMFGKYSNAYEFFECLFHFLDGLFSDNNKSKSLKMTITQDIPIKEINRINDHLPQDVIGAIEELLAKYGLKEKIIDLVRNGLSDDHKDNEMVLFQSVYLFLDILRYHSDKKGLWNIISDAEHAFYGSYCDVLVTSDANMKYKTKSVYSYFGVSSEVVCKDDLLNYLKKTIANESNLEEPLKEVFSDQHIPTEYDENSVYCKWTRLNDPLWGYFNKLEYFLNLTTRQSWFSVSRDHKFEKCTYYSETDKFFEIMRTILCNPEIIKVFETEYVEKIKAKDSSALFTFLLSNNVHVSLSVMEEQGMIVPVMDLVCTGREGVINA